MSSLFDFEVYGERQRLPGATVLRKLVGPEHTLRDDRTTCPKCGLRVAKLHQGADDCLRELRQRYEAVEGALLDEIALLDFWGRKQGNEALHVRADELRRVLLEEK